MTVLVGRGPELAVVEELLGEAEPSLAALEVVGEPGIGKTTVWQEAVRRGEARGLRVVAARPAESEARLAFAALADLLETVGDEILALLPPPQRNAIDVALLRADAGRAPSRRLVGTALLSILRELTSRGPVLLAVDDAQWLDPPSAAALEFALRRLAFAPLRVVVSLRSDATRPGFVLAIDDARVRRLPVGPLSVAALQRIIVDRLGVALPRPVLVRLAEASGGNAFYALEIARLLADGEADRSAPLPVPDDLRTLIARRIASLPAPTRDALLEASALGRPRRGAVDTDALAPAERAGLVTVAGDGQISFTHPLFAAAVYRTASPAELRAVHGRLAEVVGDLEERARHLALATTAPDPDAARVLDAAAQSARGRGAPDSAAELTELALRLTADPAEFDERRLALASHLHLAGDFQRASSILEELAASCRGDMRARALLALADIEYWRAGESVAVGHAEQALREATDPLLRARCEAAIAMWAGTSDLVRASEGARAALELLEGREDADPSLVALALGARVRADLFLGDGLDRQPPSGRSSSRRSRRLPPSTRASSSSSGSGCAMSTTSTARAANSTLPRTPRWTRATSRRSPTSSSTGRCSSAGPATGSSPRSSRHTHERFSLTGVDMSASSIWRAYVDAHLRTGRRCAGGGHDGRAGRADALGPRSRSRRSRRRRLRGGFDAARRGRRGAEADRLPRACDLAHRRRRDRGCGRSRRPRQRTRGLAELEERPPARGSRGTARWPRVAAVSCWPPKASVDGAADALDRALEEHDACPMPFELARTLLVAGQVRRRLKQKRQARELLARAGELFDGLGAQQWGERAREEQRGPRPARRRPTSRPPSSASRVWPRRASRTTRSPRRPSSAARRSRRTSVASTASSGSRRAHSSRARSTHGSRRRFRRGSPLLSPPDRP